MLRIVITVLTAFFILAVNEEVTPTPKTVPSLHVPTAATVEVPHSLFEGDICASPCWFGLIAGKSTAQDVSLFVQNADQTVFCCWDTGNGSEFDGRTGYMINGAHFFYWRDFARPDDYQTNSGLTIHQGILDSMWILMKGIVPLKEVLDKFGHPERTRFGYGLTRPYLILDYTQIPLRVVITGQDHCTMRDIGTNFWVDRVEYYSPRYIEEFKWSAGYGDPKLPDVPANVWTHWLSGGDDTPCNKVIEQLWALPTLTPTPIETQEAP